MALDGGVIEAADEWDIRLDAELAHAALRKLAIQHRAALTLRYLDDLTVAEVAAAMRLGGMEVPVEPRPEFAADLRRRLEQRLDPDIPTIAVPPRRIPMTTHATPYLAVHDGAAALSFYTSAFGAIEVMRVVMEPSRIGHAEFRIGAATFYLSDEFPEIGVVSPRTLGGSSVTLHLEVGDVDTMYAEVVEAGAEALAEPADQPHGARHGTLVDPFGHRWMLSQQVEQVPAEVYGERLASYGMRLEQTPAVHRPAAGGIWAALNFADADAGIAFMVEVLGFVPDLVVQDAEPGIVAHSQLRWPEGGIIQAASAHRPGNVFSDRPVGSDSIYVITADPMVVYDRCLGAGVDILMEPGAPDYDPQGLVFSIRDPEGNLWSFGTYDGEG